MNGLKISSREGNDKKWGDRSIRRNKTLLYTKERERENERVVMELRNLIPAVMKSSLISGLVFGAGDPTHRRRTKL